MNKILSKLFSATLVLILVLTQSSTLMGTLYASSEIQSEQTSSVNSDGSENKKEKVSLEKNTRATYSEHSGIGNQNPSELGMKTYLTPNEATEDSLKTILEMQDENPYDYLAVDDLDANLVKEAYKGEIISEGIIFSQFDPSMTAEEINAEIASRLSYIGSCWNDQTANSKIIKQKVVDSDECHLLITDFGYYYNIETYTYKPIDLKLNVNYLDFFNSPTEQPGAGFALIVDKVGISFQTLHTEELEFTFEYMLKDGTLVNVPTFYNHTDYDHTLSLGLNKEDVYKVTTYYQDPENPTSPVSGTYSRPYIGEDGNMTNHSVFNYEPYYNYALDNVNQSLLGYAYFLLFTRDFKIDRSIYNQFDAFNNADGTYEPSERGWNRIKFLESDDTISIFDSWGVNTGLHAHSTNHENGVFVSDGKDGNFVVEMNSSATMTLNMNAAFIGIDPINKNSSITQINTIVPYTNTEPIIRKSMSESNPNGVAEIGEELKYSIELDNILEIASVDELSVRDSLIENLPAYLTWDGTVSVKDADGNDVEYTGSLETGDFVLSSIKPHGRVTISYTVALNSYPSKGVTIKNVATNDGEDPVDRCDTETQGPTCAATEIPVADPGYTEIKKTVTDEDGTNTVSQGEKLNYKIVVSNPSDTVALDVLVRDSLFELPLEELKFNDDLRVEGSSYTGSLQDGTFTLDTVGVGEVVTITYSFTVVDIPLDVLALINVVTDNGEDPNEVDYETCDDTDCSSTSTDLDNEISNPEIFKSVVDEDGTATAKPGEKLTYTIMVANHSVFDLSGVKVRDSILEKMPKWAVYNKDIKIIGSEYTGNLLEGTLVLDQVPSGESVYITYSLTINDYSLLEKTIDNIVTMDGNDPNTIDKDACAVSLGCASTSTPLDSVSNLVVTGAKIVTIIIASVIVLVGLLVLKKYINKK